MPQDKDKRSEYYLPAGNHVIDLANGMMLGPGDSVALTNEEAKDPHNKRYIDEGILLKLEGGDEE